MWETDLPDSLIYRHFANFMPYESRAKHYTLLEPSSIASLLLITVKHASSSRKTISE